MIFTTHQNRRNKMQQNISKQFYLKKIRNIWHPATLRHSRSKSCSRVLRDHRSRVEWVEAILEAKTLLGGQPRGVGKAASRGGLPASRGIVSCLQGDRRDFPPWGRYIPPMNGLGVAWGRPIRRPGGEYLRSISGSLPGGCRQDK